MRAGLRLLTLVVCLGAALPARAGEADPLRGMYVGLRAIGSVADMDAIDARGFSGPLISQNDDDEVGGAGGMLGYRWRSLPLRTEIEAAHRVRFDLDLQDGGPPLIDYEANVRTTSVLFNAFYEWRNASAFTPFVGGTVGWARNVADSDRVVVATQARANEETEEDHLAWGGMAGVDWRFAESFSAELAYRYIDLGEVEVGPFAAGDGVSVEDYTSHDVMLSLSYRF